MGGANLGAALVAAGTLELPPEDPVPPYGATVEQVRGLLPHRLISATSRPTAAQVAAFLSITSAWIAARLGDTTALAADVEAALVANATGLAVLGAAALTEAAGAPERTGMADGGYAGWLWDRYKEGIDEELEALGKATDAGPGDIPAPVGDRPATIAPDPLFYRDTRF